MDCICTALEQLLSHLLTFLEECFDIHHAMGLMSDEDADKLWTVASHGDAVSRA